ncbi:TetR/AcrR family transcriptional regulator [Gordonia sp. CPCC 206044]|uniref:TetR/AcrR family transcriptional regulator n=1 Tax=Gordonia sp. CPCC 206044 TaxID=3140793 RepID=UPI003AF3D800
MQTDQRIVVAMTELLRRQGYAATGVKQVIDAAGAPNGSIYHHFPGGKRKVAEAALRQSGAAYAELVASLIAPHENLVEAIEAAFVAAADDMEQAGWMNLCPVGTVAGETADAEPDLRLAAAEVFESWMTMGAQLFASYGLDDDDARSLIVALVSSLEGAFIVARTLRSREPILAAGRSMAAYAAAMPTHTVGASSGRQPAS